MSRAIPFLRRLLASATVLAIPCLAPSPAEAHGAFPQSALVFEDRSDAERLWVGTSFGLLRSSDRGQTWYWLCEDAPGYEGVKPRMDVSGDGSLLIGSFDGIAVSHDGGCSWRYADGPTDRLVTFLHTETQAPDNVLGLVSMGQAGGVFLNQVWHTPDNGRTFTQLGDDLDPTLLAFSLMNAPSLPERIYVSGNIRQEEGSPAQGVLMVSDDRGLSWQPRFIPGADSTHPAHVLGVHPEDEDTLFVRIDGDPTDSLLISRDAGMTFDEVLTGKAEIFGFAFDPDLSQVRIGFGDARDPTKEIDTEALGIWVAPLGDSLNFTRVMEGAIGCLRWINGQLYACTAQFVHGYELGRSSGDTNFEQLLTLAGVEDVLSCGDETQAGQICPAQWADTCNLIGKCVPGGTGGAAGAGGGGTSGNAGTNSAGGETGGGGGCGCRVTATPEDPSNLAWFVPLGWLLHRRRRGR